MTGGQSMGLGLMLLAIIGYLIWAHVKLDRIETALRARKDTDNG